MQEGCVFTVVTGKGVCKQTARACLYYEWEWLTTEMGVSQQRRQVVSGL